MDLRGSTKKRFKNSDICIDIHPDNTNFDIKIGHHSSNSGMIKVAKPLYNAHINFKRKYKIHIGNYTQIGEGFTIISSSAHTKELIINNLGALPRNKRLQDLHSSKFVEQYGDVKIGNDVWIGKDCFVKGGITIGDGAVLGAKAMVTHDVPPYTVVGGVPARVIGERFPKKIQKELLEIKWWDWPEEKIKDIIEIFYNPETFIKKFKKN